VIATSTAMNAVLAVWGFSVFCLAVFYVIRVHGLLKVGPDSAQRQQERRQWQRDVEWPDSTLRLGGLGR
jgi:hypothetical protein